MVSIDKFFLLGAVGGLFGSLGLGVWLWLARSGVIPLPASYLALRELHAILQFYLFLTPFILGFLLQSTPRLLEISKPMPAVARLALPGTVIAALLLAVGPQSSLPRMVIAGSIWSLALAIAALLKEAAWAPRLRFGVFACIGLVALGGGVMLDLNVPENGVILFWWAIVPIILSTGQQFIAGALGGNRPSSRASGLTLVLYLLTAVLLAYDVENRTVWHVAAIPATMTLIIFLYSTGARAILRRFNEPLGVAFASAHLWALTGAALLAAGPRYADAVLHLWGVGYAVTLIIGVSIRLVGWITDVPPLPDRAVMALLLAWQIVPLGRAFEPIMNVGERFVLPVGVTTGIVLLVWASALVRSIAVFVYRQLAEVYNRDKQGETGRV